MTDDEIDAELDRMQGVDPRRRALVRVLMVAVLPLLPVWLPILYVITHAMAFKEWVIQTYHYHDAYIRYVWATGKLK